MQMKIDISYELTATELNLTDSLFKQELKIDEEWRLNTDLMWKRHTELGGEECFTVRPKKVSTKFLFGHKSVRSPWYTNQVICLRENH